jgi:Domain of unknown function (DUF4158)
VRHFWAAEWAKSGHSESVLKTLVFATSPNDAAPRTAHPYRAPSIAILSRRQGELIRLLTLNKLDIAFVRQHRGDHNRFRIAVLMSYLQYPGRILAKDEKPHDSILNLVAEQLEIPAAAWELVCGPRLDSEGTSSRIAYLAGHEAVLDQALQGALRVVGANSAADHARCCSGTSSPGGATKEGHRSSASGGHRTPLR